VKSVSIRPTRWRRCLPPILTASLCAVAACGGGDGPSAERFCGEVDTNRDQLTNPTLTYTDDVDALLELYREVGALAPLAIEPEWNQLIVNYETASTVVPGDEASVQRVVTVAYQSEKAAATVSAWLRDNCAVELGPVATLVEHSL
jgi:hypothetical protein